MAHAKGGLYGHYDYNPMRRSLMTFNIDDGFPEAIVRGFRSGILTPADYANLTQCETLEGTSLLSNHLWTVRFISVRGVPLWSWPDMKLHLASTDYGDFLQNEPSPIHTTTIAEKCTQKLVDEFEYLRANSFEPLSTFLDYITCVLSLPLPSSATRGPFPPSSSLGLISGLCAVACPGTSYGYMIDNVVLLITGTLHERDLSELLEKCHPLGMFESISSLSSAVSVNELYNYVLVDTPLGAPFASPPEQGLSPVPCSLSWLTAPLRLWLALHCAQRPTSSVACPRRTWTR